MADFPLLQTKRLLLRSFQGGDAPAVFAIFSREIVTRYHNQERMQSPAEAEALVARRAGLWAAGMGARWAITLKERPGSVIGSCGYYNLNKASRSIEIGYDLHPTYWRQGIMTEALSAALDYCFGESFALRLNRVEALTYVAHIASIGLLSKLGFQEEGIRREHGYWKGQFHDLRSFALLRRDWEYGQSAQKTSAAPPAFTIEKGPEPAAAQPRVPLRGWII